MKPFWLSLDLFLETWPEMAPGTHFGALWDYFSIPDQKWLQEAISKLFLKHAKKARIT